MKRFIFIVSLLFSCGCGIFFSNNTYAEDLIKSYNKDTAFSQQIFTKSQTDNFNYLIVSVTPDTDWTSSGNAYGVGVNFNNVIFQFSPYSSYLLIEKPNSPNATAGVSFSSYYSSSQWPDIIGDMTWTFTLTNDLPGAGTGCPEPPPCPEPDPCEDPEENSTYIKVVLDAFWKYHTVFAGCVASLIAIFVVYRIIKGMLR